MGWMRKLEQLSSRDIFLKSLLAVHALKSELQDEKGI